MFYINGQNLKQTVHGGSNDRFESNKLIGKDFQGIIDEFRVWDEVRTAEQIERNMFGSVTGQDGLVCYLRFNEGKGDTIEDYSGNGNNGDAKGTKWVASTRPLMISSLDTQQINTAAAPMSDEGEKPVSDSDSVENNAENPYHQVYKDAKEKGVFDRDYFPDLTWINNESDRDAAQKAMPTEDVFIENYSKGLILTFRRTTGGQLAYTFISPNLGEDQPALYLIERYRLSSYLGEYGAGRTIGTFSLLPGEKTTISISSYRSEKSSSEKTDSILDSYTEKTDQEFGNSLMNEAAAGSSRKAKSSYEHDQALSVQVGGSAEASYGFGSAEIQTDIQANESISKSRATESSREEFAKNVSNATSRHAASKSAERNISVSAKSEQIVQNQDSKQVVREIQNINNSHTLNFIFRQMNQEFYTLLHLIDIRIAASGLAPVALPELDRLLESALKEEYREDVRKFIEHELSEIIDYRGESHTKFVKMPVSTANKGDQVTEYLSVDRGYKTQYQDDITGKTIEVHGIIVNADKITMRTDGVMVEAILGQGLALDDDALRTLHAEAESKELDNQIKAMQLKILRDGDEARADLFSRLFSPPSQE